MKIEAGGKVIAMNATKKNYIKELPMNATRGKQIKKSISDGISY